MVEFITYKKEKLPVRVSYYALSEYKNETGEEFDNSVEGNKHNLKMFEPIFFYSLESGHRAIGREFTINRKTDMFDILEECFMDFANVLPKFFPKLEKKKSAPAVGNRQQRKAAEKDKK